MKCKDFRELVEAYIENGIDPLKDEKIAEHISKCSECKDYVEFYRSYRLDISRFSKKSAPEGFTERVEERLSARNINESKGLSLVHIFEFFRHRFSYEAIGLAGLAIIMVLVYRPFDFTEKNFSEIDLVNETQQLPKSREKKVVTSMKEKKPVAAPGKKSEAIVKSPIKERVYLEEVKKFLADDMKKDRAPEARERKVSDKSIKTASEFDSVMRKESKKKASPSMRSSGAGKNNIVKDQTQPFNGKLSVIVKKYRAEVLESSQSSMNMAEYRFLIKPEFNDDFLRDLKKSYKVNIRKKRKAGEKLEIRMRLEKK